MIRKVLQAYRQSFTGLSRETWILSLVLMVNRCGYMAVPFMSLYVTQYLKRPATDAGLIITLFGIGSIAGAAAGGHLTDRFGYRPVQIVSAVVTGVLFLVFAAITHFSTLCLLSIVIAFFAEAFRPANFTAIAAYAAPGTETRSYSLNRLATNIGWAVGTSLGGILASINYHLLFLVDGTINVLAGLAIFAFLPSRSAIRKTVGKIKRTVAGPWQDSWFIKFLLLTTVFSTCFFLMFRVGPLYFKEGWKMDEAVIGIILGLNGVIIALFEMVLVNWLTKKTTSLYFVHFGALMVAGSFLFLVLPFNIPVILATASVSLFTLGEMFAIPFINTFVVSSSNESNRGQYAAAYTMSWSVAQVIGPSGGFFIAEKIGYVPLWYLLVFLLLFCAAGFRQLYLSVSLRPSPAVQRAE